MGLLLVLPARGRARCSRSLAACRSAGVHCVATRVSSRRLSSCRAVGARGRGAGRPDRDGPGRSAASRRALRVHADRGRRRSGSPRPGAGWTVTRRVDPRSAVRRPGRACSSPRCRWRSSPTTWACCGSRSRRPRSRRRSWSATTARDVARGGLEVRRPRLGRRGDRLPRHRAALRRHAVPRATRRCPGTPCHAGPPALDPSLVKVAAALAVLGFATKAGLAPMHSWLPDAHSQAPAPVSGLMSGVLLVGRVLRDPAGPGDRRPRDRPRPDARPAGHRGPALPRRGRGSRAATARLQADARLLEHRAHGPARARRRRRTARWPSRPHCCTSSATAWPSRAPFVVSGRILLAGGHHLHLRDPYPAAPASRRWRSPSCRGMVALLGLPPFSLFFSEVAIVVAGVQRGMGWVMARRRPARAGDLRRAVAAPVGHGVRFPVTLRRPRRSTGRRTVHGCRSSLALGVTAVIGFAAGPFATCSPGPPPRWERRDDHGVTTSTARHAWLRQVERRLGDGYRLALVAGHEDDDCFRVVYVLVRAATTTGASSVLRTGEGRAGDAQPGRGRLRQPVGSSGRSATCSASRRTGHPLQRTAGAARPLAAGLVPDATRRRPRARRSSRTSAPSRSWRSRARASTRSRSDRCTPG